MYTNVSGFYTESNQELTNDYELSHFILGKELNLGEIFEAIVTIQYMSSFL